jgi:hypothetical protein
VFVAENETTYLAFPPVNDAVVIHGAGHGLSRLAPLAWLHERDLIKPVNTDLPMLTEPESNLYRDLIEDRCGQQLRLEQERVRFSAVQAAIERLSHTWRNISPPPDNP